MISRFIAGLTSPSKITTYRYDKWYMPLLLILIMTVIALIPIIYHSTNVELLTYEVEKEVRTSFVHGELVEYKIENGALISLSSEPKITKVQTEIGQFLFSSIEATVEELTEYLNFVFLDDHFSLYAGRVKVMSLEYKDIPTFEGLDFRLAKADDRDFWNIVFTETNNILDEFASFYVTANVVGNIVVVIFDVLTCALLMALLMKFQTREKFGRSFKMSLYCSVPLFIGIVLTLMYGIGVFNTIGLIWSFVFSYRVSMLIRFKGGL